MATKRMLSIGQIITMSFGFLGIQAGFALQNGNTSRILRSFGADVESLPAFWLVAPLIGMIVQPIIGYYSDKTWGWLGRRKPYFLAGAILSSLALMLIPNSGILVTGAAVLWVAAGFVMIMDASFNIAMEPFRALVADNLSDKQRTMGFSIQTCLIGIGAVIGSNLPKWLAESGVSREIGASGVPDNVKWAFYIGAAIFMAAILVTVFFTKEYTPKEYEAIHGIEFQEKSKGFWDDVVNMPKTMKQLGLVQFCSWFALFTMWVFTTDAVAMHVMGMSGDYAKSIEYTRVGDEVGSSFGTYNLVSALYALMLPFIAGQIGRRMTHAVSLVAGGIGLISIFFLKDLGSLHYCMIGVGMAWASILAMPYAMLAGSIPAARMGMYMGIFNLFITLPQITNGILGSWMVTNLYGGKPIYALVTAGVLFIIGALATFIVDDKEERVTA
jgi:maltose/moltooligosaccharide transporter